MLTVEQAQDAFRAMAALGNEIAFGWLFEGCECRAQLMIERLQAMGLEPGRAWAVAVGSLLRFSMASDPRRSYKWGNHVAPTLAVEGVEHGVLVVDPSLSPSGPLALLDWAQTMRARAVYLSNKGLSEAEVLALQSARALQGEQLDAVVFNLRLGEPPITNLGGSGFRLDRDPPEGVGAFVRDEMQRLLELEHGRRPARS